VSSRQSGRERLADQHRTDACQLDKPQAAAVATFTSGDLQRASLNLSSAARIRGVR
jgi:hypothetical protein